MILVWFMDLKFASLVPHNVSEFQIHHTSISPFWGEMEEGR
ncbi:MAG: hypothetical protein RLY97_1374 [Pseudomonadota bacterium]